MDHADLKNDIFRKKYQYNDETWEQFLDRVAGNNRAYRELMAQGKVMPGGRILANRGTVGRGGRKGTYSNCYVITPPEDSLESIYDADYKLARTFSYGGGCGVDISYLAPKGARVNNSAETSSGSVSFFEQFAGTANRIAQKGRRGALIGILSIDHPDIEEFINLKNDLSKATKANISVKVSSRFMQSLIEDHSDYYLEFYRPETDDLISKRINPKKLFRKIAESAWRTGEPGMLFWDRINEWNLCSEIPDFVLGGVNPCGEEPLVSGGSCLLVAINLSAFIKDPFTEKAKFDFDGFKYAVMQSVIYANEILDEGIQLHPLKEQVKAVSEWRQIGVEIMGLADAFIKMRMTYGDIRSIELSDQIGKVMINAALEQSALLAKEQGPFPKYSEKVLNSRFLNEVANENVIDLIRKHGLRNSQLLTIGPTGSISNLVGVNGGIEPFYAFKYRRKTESLHGKDKYYTVEPPIVKEYREITGKDDLSEYEYFVVARDVPPLSRLLIQRTWQTYIDAGISSTINLKNDVTVEEVEELFLKAYSFGLKGLTIFREGCERTPVFSTPAPSAGEKIGGKTGLRRGEIEPIPKLSDGNRQVRLATGCGTIHLNITRNGKGKINQVFIQRGSKGTCLCNQVALSRAISLLLRAGVDVYNIIDQLESVPPCPSYYGKKKQGKKLSPGSSCSSAVAHQLRKYQEHIEGQGGGPEAPEEEKGLLCPDCGSGLIPSEGCFSCICGYSRCS